MALKKYSIIEEIKDLGEFEKLVSTVLDRSNLKKIQVTSPFISAYIEGPFSVQVSLFYMTLEYLGRNYPLYDSFVKSIEKKISGNSYNSVYIVSTKNITEGFKDKLNKHFKNSVIVYWDRDEVVKQVNEKFDDFWRHNDQDLLNYEKLFESEANDDWQIKKIRQFKSAHEKLLKIFVEPRLQHKVNDFESKKKAFEKTSLEKLKEFTKPVVLEGEPGIGKSRLLKQIGMEFINSNNNSTGSKFLPVFINNINLIETRSNEKDLIDINKAIEKKLSKYFPELTINDLTKNYSLVILIDSLDEFNKATQERIFRDLKNYCNEQNHVFIGTRFHDHSSINGISVIGKCEEVYVEKFNDHQIRTFLSSYFLNDKNKADNLMESLKENFIIQRLPITPLNLSLISILYEENNFEIPATITDIYDNFNNLLLGRALPDSRFDFFDINIRERILSSYALKLLETEERNYMTKKEFYNYFLDFFAPVKTTIKLELLPEALDFLINNTGILILQDNTYVKFLHESYMEYYASREIFFYLRGDYEPKLIENFLEINWQYCAIFYAGRTKKMNGFLWEIIKRTSRSKKIGEYYRSINGLGYISQALYMSDDNIRKEAVLSALTYILETYEWMKKLGSDEKLFFRTLSMPLTAVINTMTFFEAFNSITIRGPLELAFEDLFLRLEETDENGLKVTNSNIGFKLFTIALTLSNPRLGNIDKMRKLILETALLNDPLFEKLLDFGLSIAGSKDLYLLKEDLKRPSRAKANNEIIKFNKNAEELYLSAPIGRFRFTTYDRISPERRVLLLTEGKTDAQIIEHAFVLLTDSVPYWEIQPIHEINGGAAELAKCLANSSKLAFHEKVIGIFDNDEGGIHHFTGGLPDSKFAFFEQSDRIKKHKEAEIYGVKLPIPPFKSVYYQKDQKFNFFSIEQYFSDDYLKSQNMLLETPMSSSGIYKVRDSGSAKAEFSKYIRTETSPKIFKEFIHLFREIDLICGVDDIDYNFD